jgi:hypothetical protein
MEKTWKPTVAGILAILAGALQVIVGIAIAAVSGIGGALIGIGWLTGWLGAAISAPLIVFGIIAIIGGIYALRRNIWGLALAGSICALIGPWFILGVLAIIFVSLGKREFK